VSRDLVYKSGTWSWQAHRLGDFSQFLLGRPQPRKITAVSRDNFVGDLPFYSVRETVFMKSFKGFKFATLSSEMTMGQRVTVSWVNKSEWVTCQKV